MVELHPKGLNRLVPPLKSAFNDAIKAGQDRERLKNEAEASEP